MNQNDVGVKLGEAWQAHYDGQQEVAIERFQAIVAEAPDHIDANWGLGLSYRKVGDAENALLVFRKVQELVESALEANTGNYERFFMLKRMVSQQIDQMSDFIT